MATIHEIQFVTRSSKRNIHSRIAYIGGHNGDGLHWKLTPKEAIEGIKAGYWKFYISLEDQKSDVFIDWSITGDPYLKTDADAPGNYHLLQLPECI